MKPIKIESLVVDDTDTIRPRKFLLEKAMPGIEEMRSRTGQLPVIEIFEGIEGEGLDIGVPRAFVRFSGCPIRCYNCDTPHSWYVSGAKLVMTIEQIVSEVKGMNVRQVSLTGGEPLMYPAQIGQLNKALKAEGFETWLETSGVLFHEVLSEFDTVSMDIKSPGFGIILTDEYIDLYKDLYLKDRELANVQFKTVVQRAEDLEYLEQKFMWLLQGTGRPLVLTPGTNTRAAITKGTLAKELADLVALIQGWNKRYNIRIIAQQHQLLNLP